MAGTLQQDQCSIWGALAQQELDTRTSSSSGKERVSDVVDVLERWSADKQLDINSYGFLLRQAMSIQEGRRIVAHIVRRGLAKHTFLKNLVMDMFKRCGEPEEAVRVFLDQMERRNHFSWNIVMSAQLQLDHSGERAKRTFDRMPIGRDVVSWNAMLAALVSSEEMDLAVEAWHKMACHNLVSWNAVIAVCSRRGDLAAALSVFEWMPDRDLVSWNAILSACVQNGENEQALELWERMQQDAVKADKITLTTLLDACANLGLDALGASLLQCTIKWNSGEPDVVVANAVLNFHVRCGNVSDAKAVFETIKYRRDVVSWSSMVAAVHDDVAEALDLLRLMLLDGVAPNKITSLGVLSVCSHAGALDAGCSFFLSLEADYHTRLALEHYICMIDLVGRAGNFDGAQELMHSMPFEADNVAWRILMAAYLQYYSA
ncbi:hypothetical protein SELMODRAFT_92328 [Selaginella moellendorffii]|uniref:Pentacotripeptide-repeat region of PRORP domain-containing protein n=1 Tax=Selaginella moellendorffii TaxID=88036 RepID=D8RG95_SELML|nr:hypothetical protein SELMODRAFT_92328 [Selaginella moellendorffii]